MQLRTETLSYSILEEISENKVLVGILRNLETAGQIKIN